MRHAWLAIVIVIAACSSSKSSKSPPEPTPTPTPTTTSDAATARRWTVRFESRRPPGVVASYLEASDNGEVVMAFAVPTMAPTVAMAKPDLIAKLAADLVDKPLPPETPVDNAKQYALAVRVTDAKGQVTGEKIYDYESAPPSIKDVWMPLSALVNSPRKPLRCPRWDGTGGFNIISFSQNYGAAPGPIHQLAFGSDGLVVRTTASGGIGAPFVEDKRTHATPAEV